MQAFLGLRITGAKCNCSWWQRSVEQALKSAQAVNSCALTCMLALFLFPADYSTPDLTHTCGFSWALAKNTSGVGCWGGLHEHIWFLHWHWLQEDRDCNSSPLCCNAAVVDLHTHANIQYGMQEVLVSQVLNLFFFFLSTDLAITKPISSIRSWELRD